MGTGPHWIQPYKIRRSARVLSFIVRQNHTLLETAGETCYLLQRLVRADAPFTVAPRRVSTITKVVSSVSAYDTDPDTGFFRYKLWGASSDLPEEYPDIQTMTVTVQASGVASPWEPAVDKYTFIGGRTEFAFDQYQDLLDTDGNRVEDALYLVFNTPPFISHSVLYLSYGTINPLVNFHSLQPVRDTQEKFKLSLFGYTQWLNKCVRVRTMRKPHAILVAFPNVMSDFKITDGGLLRESKSAYFTSPPPYSPKIDEHDIIIRASTGVRYQITNDTPIYVEDQLVAQHFEMAELDPRSSIYSIEYLTG